MLPGVYVALPSLLLTASADTGVRLSVSVAVLLPGVGSTTVGGTMMVTVLAMVPVAPGAIAAVTVYVAVPPLSSETSSLRGPLPLALPQADPTEAAQVQLVKVTPAGGLSTTFAPATAFGPALLATIVYVVLVPGTTFNTPSVLVTPRLATPVAASVAATGNGFDTPCADVNAPAGSGLIRLPAELATTLTWTRQLPLAAIDALVSDTDVAPASGVNVPPQVLLAAGAAATAMPIGKLSVSAPAVSAIALALVLMKLIVSCDVPPTRTVAGLNDLLIVTLVTTRVTVALAAAGLMKPWVELTALAAIVFVPDPAPAGVVTLTRIVQLEAAAPPGRAPPTSETVLVPEVAVAAPPQLLTRFGVVETTCPAGSVSVNARPVSATAPAARESVIVIRVSPPAATVVGANALATDSTGFTVSTPVIADCVRPKFVCNVPCAIVLVRAPVTALAATCTGMVIVQLPAAGMVPPAASVTVVAVFVSTPPQVVVGAAATVNPAPIEAMLSTNAAVSVAIAAFELVSVIVSVDVAPCKTGVGANTLLPPTLVTALTTSAPVAEEKPTPPKLPTGIVLLSVTGLAPALTPTTLIVTVQLALLVEPAVAPGRLPPLTVNELLPAVGAGVKARPAQVVAVTTGAATVIPAGNVSVNAMVPASGVVLKLRTVTVSVDVPPVVIGVGAKTFSTRAPVCRRTLAANAAALETPWAVPSAFATMVLATLPST